MVGNLHTVTAAPAGTPAPSVQKNAQPVGLRGMPAGNPPPAAGRNLPPPEPPVSAGDVERAVQRLSELMSETQRSLRFQVDELSGRTVITVLDAETQEVVRQIPSPELLAVMRHLERIGALLDTHG
jgi:flagellar protein FlaG